MRNTNVRFLVLSVVCGVFLFGLTACEGITPRVEPPKGSLAVAHFTQPQMDNELLAGYIPEGAEPVSQDVLGRLDELLKQELKASTNPSYLVPSTSEQCEHIVLSRIDKEKKRVAALDYWLRVGNCMKVDYLLVPHLLAFHERKGSEVSVDTPAGVTLDLFLVDVKNESLVKRYHFDETQKSLTENLFEAHKFFKRKGKWITASELAQEGLARGVKEFGL
ncbi:hypothetical protein [Desulfobaculum bizertense]|uniref:Lipoprotein n=1 Tax=Desulfobaculum bizertense DSM 18034 TaxID=1121442 RepID=A0A1T4VL14_9BACT|nr:hypothetical protein [Desulfobaculum bizertense]UIJ38107.1 hypothetical protein LWC08_00665 [Desulfobaculum bizertense]SKA65619.1 hypothetical protein SAMN02745702_00581 [Desulfobaculum bizertense DSM 18034]